jgi:hypothetical protein
LTLVSKVFIKKCSGKDHYNNKEMGSMDITREGVKTEGQDYPPFTASTSSIGDGTSWKSSRAGSRNIGGGTSEKFAEGDKCVGVYVQFLTWDRFQQGG